MTARAVVHGAAGAKTRSAPALRFNGSFSRANLVRSTVAS
jgi:hypothetical protein